MSSKRLNKRQLREQQELDELADAPIPTASSLAASKKSPFQQLDDEPSDDDDDNDEEEEEQEGKTIQKKPTTTSLFAALGDGADEQDDQDESEPDQDISTQQAPKSSKKKNKKKKKKAAAAAADSPQANPEAADLGQDAQPKSTSTGTKKSSKKKPATSSAPAAAKSKDVSEMSIDEFDALLASQSSLNDASTKGSNPASSSSSSTTTTLNRVSAFRTHLSLDPRNLDPAIELRRQFGSAAIKAYQNEAASSSSTGRATSGARARAQANNPNLKVRSLLCTPKDHWPPISRSFTGMSMDVLDSPTHGRICAWKHSKAYRQVQMQFLQAVRSYDPNALMALLRVYPFHIDMLLQLSEYSRHQGDLGQAADFNDRALFALERCASPYFTSCLSSTTSGPPLVNFNKIENRAFYLAIHRNIGFLGRRGTWRTALEWAKLLLGLGQDGEDHHAALLWIDFLAIKSRQHRWLLDLIHKLDEQRSRASAAPGGGVSHVQDLSVPARTIVDAADKEPAGEGAHYSGTLDWCVGLAYSRALALRAIEKEEGDKTGTRSNAALRLAIARFPAAVPLLCSKAGIELPSKLAGHAAFQLRTRFDPAHDTLPDLLTHIYVLRSDSLWKEPGYAEWLRSTAMTLADALVTDFELGSKRKSAAAVAALTTRRGIYRHVLVSDVPDTVRQQLVAYLPPEITASSAQMDAFDPVPPSARAGVLGSPSTHIDAEVETITRYDDEYFAPIMTELSSSSTRSRGATEADAGGGGGGMMHALRRALAGLGGVHGWDAALDAMDDETRQDVLAQVMHMAHAAQQQQGEAAMPGAFAVAEEEAEMAAARPGAFAAIRAAMDAIWGGGGGQRDDEEEEEEEE